MAHSPLHTHPGRRHCCRRRTRQTLMVLMATPPSLIRRAIVAKPRPSALSWWMRSIAACSLGAGTSTPAILRQPNGAARLSRRDRIAHRARPDNADPAWPARCRSGARSRHVCGRRPSSGHTGASRRSAGDRSLWAQSHQTSSVGSRDDDCPRTILRRDVAQGARDRSLPTT